MFTGQTSRKRPGGTDISKDGAGNVKEPRKGLARPIQKAAEPIGARLRSGETDFRAIMQDTAFRHNLMERAGDITRGSKTPDVRAPLSRPGIERVALERLEQAREKLKAQDLDLAVSLENLRAKMAPFNFNPQATESEKHLREDLQRTVISLYREIGQCLDPEMFNSSKAANEIQSLRKELETNRKNFSDALKLANGANGILRKTLQDTMRRQKATVESREDLTVDFGSTSAGLETLENELEALKTELESRSEVLNSSRNESDVLKTKLQTKADMLQNIIDLLRAKMQSKLKDLDTSRNENDILKTALASKSKELDSSLRESDVLKAELRSKSEEVSTFRHENDVLKAELELKSADVKTSQKKIKALEDQLQARTGEIRKLQTRKEAHHAAIHRKSVEIEALKWEVDQRLAALQAKLHEKSVEEQASKAMADQKIVNLTAELQKSSAEEKASRAEREKLIDEKAKHINALSHRVQDVEALLDKSGDKVMRLRMDIDVTTKENQRWQVGFSAKERALSAATSRILELESHGKARDERLEAVELANSRLEAENKADHDEMEYELSYTKSELRAELNEARAEAAVLNQQREIVEEWNCCLETELAITKENLQTELCDLRVEAEELNLQQDAFLEKGHSLGLQLATTRKNWQTDVCDLTREVEELRLDRDSLQLYKDASLILVNGTTGDTLAFKRYGIDTAPIQLFDQVQRITIDWSSSSAAYRPIKLLLDFNQIMSKMLKVLYLSVYHSKVNVHQLLSLWYTAETCNCVSNKQLNEFVPILFRLCKQVFASSPDWNTFVMVSFLMCQRLLTLFPEGERARLQGISFATENLCLQRQGLWQKSSAYGSLMELLDDRVTMNDDCLHFQCQVSGDTAISGVWLELLGESGQVLFIKKGLESLPAILEMHIEDLSMFFGKGKWRVCIHRPSNTRIMLTIWKEDTARVLNWFRARKRQLRKPPLEWIDELVESNK